MRVRNAGPHAAAFANQLLAIGDGRLPYRDSVEIPEQWRIEANDRMDLINAIYPAIRLPNQPPDQFRDGAILATKTADVDDINNKAFSVFPGEKRQYTSIDRIIDADDPDIAAASYPPEFLNGLNSAGIPPHCLELKVGMPLVLLRNLDPSAGLCNGTKLTLARLMDHCIAVRCIAHGPQGAEHILPRINLCTKEGEMPFILCGRQLPVRAAFAMAIHKAQG